MFEIGQKVYYIDNYEIVECTIQGILKRDSQYQDKSEYVYFLEDTKMLPFRNITNEYFKEISEDKIYTSEDEANKSLNRFKKERIEELNQEIESLKGVIN